MICAVNRLSPCLDYIVTVGHSLYRIVDDGGCRFMIACQSRSIRTVGEGREKGRSYALLYSRYSTSVWIEEVMVRRLRLSLGVLLDQSL